LVIFVVVISGAWTALKRVALPWLGAQYTQVEVQPRNVELPMGHSVEIAGVFTGRPPLDPQLHWQPDGEPAWRAAAMAKSGDGAFVHPLTNVTVPVKYRVSGGDAISPEFQVTPYLPPEVKELRIGLAYPEYTKLKPVAQTAPDITILRGSTATLHVRANVSLSRARLCFSGTNQAPVDLQKDANELWTGSLKILQDSDYSIELFDEKGRRSEVAAPHHIVATADNPPKVEILEPGQDMRADATNRIPIRVSVADDYGVAGINVIYHKLNGAAQTVGCQTESAKNGEWIASTEINLATLGLTNYDVVAYHVEARDNNTLDGPGIGRSSLYFIEITDKESGPAPPLPPMPGEQINLLVVQKQIIADTVVLDARSPATNYFELALRQTNAVELGRMYLETMAVAPAEAVVAMKAAIGSMEEAVAPLNKCDRVAAIPPEEAALAHLYRVLALLPDLKILAVPPTPPQMTNEQKPQMTVALREIKKPAPEPPPADPEIEKALEEAKELSRAQAELNAIGEKLIKAESRGENPALAAGEKQAPPPANGKGEGKGQGQGEGKGKGPGANNGQKLPGQPGAEKQFAKNTNSINLEAPQIAQTTNAGATNNAPKRPAEPGTRKPSEASKQTSPTKQPPMTKSPTQTAQLAQAQSGKGEGTKPGKGQGKGKGKATAAGPKGKGKGQGTKPANGSGQPSNQQDVGRAEMDAINPDDAPDTTEELAQEEEELSAEAKALGGMLRRLAGKGTRVGHNLAVTANKAAEHMEGAALALKQGNASGAGRRGTMSSAELDQVVGELERILGKRPDLTDVASEEAPKEYEAFISEYFRKLSYEK
jgi:hypothetical protein